MSMPTYSQFMLKLHLHSFSPVFFFFFRGVQVMGFRSTSRVVVQLRYSPFDRFFSLPQLEIATHHCFGS